MGVGEGTEAGGTLAEAMGEPMMAEMQASERYQLKELDGEGERRTLDAVTSDGALSGCRVENGQKG